MSLMIGILEIFNPQTMEKHKWNQIEGTASDLEEPFQNLIQMTRQVKYKVFEFRIILFLFRLVSTLYR